MDREEFGLGAILIGKSETRLDGVMLSGGFEMKVSRMISQAPSSNMSILAAVELV